MLIARDGPRDDAVSIHPAKPRLAATHVGTYVLLALLLGAIGYGCYVGGTYVVKWRSYRQAEEALAANRLDEALRLFRKYLDDWPKDVDAHFLAARAARRLREFKEAETHLFACKELGFDAEKLRLEYAMMQAQRDAPAPVEGYLLTLVGKQHPESGSILEALIEGNLKIYQLPRAHQCVEKWLQIEPDNLQAIFWRGMIWAKVANYRAAMTDFEQVVAGQPENREARLNLAGMLLNVSKQYDTALEHFQLLRAADPNNLEVRLGLAGCYVGQSRLEEAQALLDQIRADYPDNPVALSECGKLALQLGQPRQAEEWLRRSLEQDPYDPESVYSYSLVLQQLGRSDEAKHYHDKHATIIADLHHLDELGQKAVTDPKNAALRHEIGLIFMRNGREKDGLGWFTMALQANPRYAPTHKVLADYCERHGMPAEAARHREQAQLSP
jgi:tetratricopeptide (TPR) repeat protein